MKKFLVLVAAVCMAYTTAFAQTVKPFKEGDRAVFLGICLFVYSMEVLVVIQRMI